MTIDLREEAVGFRDYVSRVIEEHLRRGLPKPGMIHVGFTFDQDGWVFVYFDTRPGASRDGEWTTHTEPETILARAHWHRASEIRELREVVFIEKNGIEMQQWSANPNYENLANIFGEFLRSSVLIFEAEGLFQPIFGKEEVKYCVEELTAFYEWPIDPEVLKLAKSLGLRR